MVLPDGKEEIVDLSGYPSILPKKDVLGVYSLVLNEKSKENYKFAINFPTYALDDSGSRNLAENNTNFPDAGKINSVKMPYSLKDIFLILALIFLYFGVDGVFKLRIEFERPFILLAAAVLGVFIWLVSRRFSKESLGKRFVVWVRIVLITLIILALSVPSLAISTDKITTIYLADMSESNRKNAEKMKDFIQRSIKLQKIK